ARPELSNSNPCVWPHLHSQGSGRQRRVVGRSLAVGWGRRCLVPLKLVRSPVAASFHSKGGDRTMKKLPSAAAESRRIERNWFRKMVREGNLRPPDPRLYVKPGHLHEAAKVRVAAHGLPSGFARADDDQR